VGADLAPSPRVKVETSLLVPGSWSDELPLMSGIATVEALLRHIGDGISLDLLDDQGDLIDFLDVKLNDKDVNFLPARLGTRLQNDHRVTIKIV